jgi:hypothetical protein
MQHAAAHAHLSVGAAAAPASSSAACVNTCSGLPRPRGSAAETGPEVEAAGCAAAALAACAAATCEEDACGAAAEDEGAAMWQESRHTEQNL